MVESILASDPFFLNNIARKKVYGDRVDQNTKIWKHLTLK